jgi:alpha-tubulin suppressor-like RCC1 family protein
LNDKGQLGDGTTINRNVPTQIGTDSDWAIIKAFTATNLALKTDGSLWSWGNNNYGQGGDGNFGTGVFNTSPTHVGNDNDWVKIASGDFAFAIKSNGTLWGWGANVVGNLGTGNTDPHYIPFQIGTDTDWNDVSSGASQTLALKIGNTLWGWGLNKSGSLAIGPVNNMVLVPTQTGDNTADWEKISVGGCCSSKMIKTDGTLWAMGSGTQGNIGNGNSLDVNTPTQVDEDTDWETMTTSFHTLAIKNDSSLWGWGLNLSGQLGDGTLINKNIPIEITSNIDWSKLATGLGHTIAITTNGTLYSWGRNDYSQLGNGTNVNLNVPAQVGSECSLNRNSFKNEINFKISPNPTTDIVNIDYSLKEDSFIEAILCNSIGQILSNNKYNAIKGKNETQINISTYAKGIYLLTLKAAGESVTVKVIKQ